ncbi:MAG: hypothetical protein JNL82_25290 [Myxococcales bacterium]|nr:hypothetical protein [Myxococcales bacterium]
MRRISILVVLAVLVVVGVCLLPGWGGPGGVVVVERGGAEAGRVEVARAAGRGEAARAAEERREARARRIREGAGERAVLRERIAEAVAARERGPRRGGGAERGQEEATSAKKVKATGEETDGDEGAGTRPAMVDRSGNRGYLTQVMSRELLPLADECFELARGRDPELAGMLVIDVELLGDEELGGVVEAAEPGEGNEIRDREVIECVRESLLATTLPPPPQGGRDAFSLSLRLEDEG